MKLFRMLLLGSIQAILLAGCIGTDVIDDFEATMPPTTDSVATQRQGTLVGQGGYTAVGTVTLRRDEAGEIIFSTSTDFRVSLALGTFLYLSNSLDGSATATNGLEIADVSASATGAQSFNVTQIAPEVTLSTYQYVIVFCKPARLVFGSAELN